MAETGWVDMYHPDQWDEKDQPDPNDEDHVGKWARVTQEAYDSVWERRGWVVIDDNAPAPVGSLQAQEGVDTTTADADTTATKSSSSRSTAKKE